MARRSHFEGICRDILDSFVSRYNDLDGYWALGQFVGVRENGPHPLRFLLITGETVPPRPDLNDTSLYYRRATLRQMAANKMPREWLANAIIDFSMIGPTTASCDIEITTDLGKVYRSSRWVEVRPHNPTREYRRAAQFGPSNRKGQ